MEFLFQYMKRNVNYVQKKNFHDLEVGYNLFILSFECIV